MSMVRSLAALGMTLMVISGTALGGITEPARPDVSRVFDNGTESRMAKLGDLPVGDAFEQLKSAEFIMDADLAHKAVYKAFAGRKREALERASAALRAPLREVMGGRVVSRLREFTVAKRIFETFPEDAALMLVPLYEHGGAITRGNILQAAGGVAGGQEIRSLLIRALDDPAAYEDEDPDAPGRPMRLCDLAYNQLVLRYNIRRVLRTLSPSHSLEDRDYQIGILKALLLRGDSGKEP